MSQHKIRKTQKVHDMCPSCTPWVPECLSHNIFRCSNPFPPASSWGNRSSAVSAARRKGDETTNSTCHMRNMLSSREALDDACSVLLKLFRPNSSFRTIASQKVSRALLQMMTFDLHSSPFQVWDASGSAPRCCSITSNQEQGETWAFYCTEYWCH